MFAALALTVAVANHPHAHAAPCEAARKRYFNDATRAGFTRNNANLQTDIRIPRALYELKMSNALLTRAPVNAADKPLANRAQGDIANATDSLLSLAGLQAATLYHRFKPCIARPRRIRLGDVTIALTNAGIALENARRDHPNRKALQHALDRIIGALSIMPEPLYGTRLREPQIHYKT